MGDEAESVNPDASGLNAPRRTSATRSRASIACVSCRLRRSRCIITSASEGCEQCRRHNLPCVIQRTDGRKRSRAKTDLNQMKQQIASLESQIQELHAVRPEKTPSDRNASPENSANEGLAVPRETEHTDTDSWNPNQLGSGDTINVTIPNGALCPVIAQRVGVSGAQSPLGPWSQCDANSHTSSASCPSNDWLSSPSEGCSVSQVVPEATENYLLDLFWDNYANVLPFVRKDSFLRAKQTEDPACYSKALHLAVLAVGYRFADDQRSDIQSLQMGKKGRESRFAKMAKKAVEADLDKSKELPLIQALLLVGDVEIALGRRNTGFMFIGMAYRLAMEAGVHKECTVDRLKNSDAHVYRALLYACLIYERYWEAVLLPAFAIKLADMKLLQLAAKFMAYPFEEHSTLSESNLEELSATLLEVIDVAGTVLQTVRHRPSPSPNGDHDDYHLVISLEWKLKRWYNNIPECMRWTPQNVATASRHYFYFHQYYYVALILLHRPFAHFRQSSLLDEHVDMEDLSYRSSDQLCQLSRMICFEHAISLAQKIIRHHTRFNAKKMLVTAIGQLDIAAMTLLMSLLYSQDPVKREKALRYLLELSGILRALADTYVVAETMSAALDRQISYWREGNSFQGLSGLDAPKSSDGHLVNPIPGASSDQEKNCHSLQSPVVSSAKTLLDFVQGPRLGPASTTLPPLQSYSDHALHDDMDTTWETIHVGHNCHHTPSCDTLLDSNRIDEGILWGEGDILGDNLEDDSFTKAIAAQLQDNGLRRLS